MSIVLYPDCTQQTSGTCPSTFFTLAAPKHSTISGTAPFKKGPPDLTSGKTRPPWAASPHLWPSFRRRWRRSPRSCGPASWPRGASPAPWASGPKRRGSRGEDGGVLNSATYCKTSRWGDRKADKAPWNDSWRELGVWSEAAPKRVAR